MHRPKLQLIFAAIKPTLTHVEREAAAVRSAGGIGESSSDSVFMLVKGMGELDKWRNGQRYVSYLCDELTAVSC